MERHQRSVTIIGGGVIGCCIAYELCKLGYKPVVIEKEAEIASGASGKAGGFLALSWNDSSSTGPLTRRSFKLHEEYSQLFGNYGYRKMKAYSASIHPEIDKNNFEILSDQKLRWLNSKSVSNLCLLSDETESAQVHPKLFCESIFSKCISLGARLVQGEAIQFCRSNNQKTILKLKIPSNELVDIESDIFIICMGAWSDRLLSSYYDKNVMDGIKAQSVVFKPKQTNSIENVALFTDWFTPGHHNRFDPEVYPRPDGTVYICAKAEPTRPPENGVSEIIEDDETIFKICQFASQLSPNLTKEQSDIVARQACLLPVTEDDIPIIGKITKKSNQKDSKSDQNNHQINNSNHNDIENQESEIFVATGHSVWGILNSPATAEAIAQLVHFGKSEIDLSDFDPNRFVE